MVKKLDALNLAKKMLSESNIPDWQMSAEYILSVALKIDHENLHKVSSLTDREYKRYIKFINVRCKHVPLDKIIGYRDFYTLRIPFNKNVLTPRNESELLADRLISDIAGVLKKNKFPSPLTLLDLCTGSGCLGLSVAHNTNVNVTLSDISKKAINIAKHNNKYNNKLRASEQKSPVNPNFVVSDLFESINCKYDIIVCNPPYIKTEELTKLEIEVRDFDPILALDGGKDGLDFYRKIIKEAPKYLTTDNGLGKIYFEIGVGQSEAIVKMLEKNFEDIEVIKDYSGIDRFIIAKKVNKDVK